MTRNLKQIVDTADCYDDLAYELIMDLAAHVQANRERIEAVENHCDSFDCQLPEIRKRLEPLEAERVLFGSPADDAARREAAQRLQESVRTFSQGGLVEVRDALAEVVRLFPQEFGEEA